MRLPSPIRLAFLLVLGLVCPALSFEIYGPFSNHMVLQRNQSITIQGRASPLTPVKLELGEYRDQTLSASDGLWALTIPPHPAETDLSLTVYTPFKHLRFENIAFGDVFLCSGQSNMEWALKHSEQGPETLAGSPSRSIRIYRVPQAQAKRPQKTIAYSPWLMASPESIRNFGAIPYYFAEAIQAHQKVPIGLILSSKKGSPIKAWTPLTAFEKNPALRKIVTRHELFMGIHKKISASHAQRFNDWQATTLADTAEPMLNPAWALPAFDDAPWATLHLPALSETNDIQDGAFWFRKEVTLPSSWTNQNIHIHMGRIRNYDRCYVNGQLIGETTDEDFSKSTHPRKYAIPASLLKAGATLFAIRVFNSYERGGLDGNASSFYLQNEKDERYPLAGPWKTQVESSSAPCKAGHPPVAPSQGSATLGPAQLYNAMIHPLKGFPIKAILWYQGESDTKSPEEYAALFPAMIQSWRKNLGRPVPFYYVQLAGFPFSGWEPEPEHWATFRAVQAEASENLERCEMVSAIDLGYDRDIHPLKKKPLAKRLAHVALSQLYGLELAWKSPALETFSLEKNSILLSIKDGGAGLTVTDGQPIAGFAFIDSHQNSIPATATLRDDQHIEVNIPPNLIIHALSYAWKNYPEGLNLYSKDGLPLLPFKVSL